MNMHLKVCFIVTVTVFSCYVCTGMYSNFVLFCLFFMHEINFLHVKSLNVFCIVVFFLDISWILYIIIGVLVMILVVSSIIIVVKVYMNRRHGYVPTPVQLRNLQEELQVQTSRL